MNIMMMMMTSRRRWINEYSNVVCVWGIKQLKVSFTILFFSNGYGRKVIKLSISMAMEERAPVGSVP